MNWRPALTTLHAALAQTFEVLCPGKADACSAIQSAFQTQSAGILQSFAPERSRSGKPWQSTLEGLREYLNTCFESILHEDPKAALDLSEKVGQLVRDMRTEVYKHAGELWDVLEHSWKFAILEADRVANEVHALVGEVNLQKIYYLSTQINIHGLRTLLHIRRNLPPVRPDTFDPALQAALAEVRFGLYLKAILDGSRMAKRRACLRLCNWAKKKHSAHVRTLTAGLPCLLEPEHAQEAIAALMNHSCLERMRGESRIPATLALCFGIEGVKFLEFFIENSQVLADKRRALRALGSIGGPGAVKALCRQLHESPLCEEALRMLMGLSKSAGPQELIPTLTSGLPCLLPEPTTHVPAALETQQASLSKTQAHVLNNLAFLFGVEAVQCFELFIRQNHPNPLPQKRGLRALGLIGGQGTVEQLCGLAWWGDTALCEETLKIIARLSSVSEGAVELSEKNPGQAIENVVMIVLNNLEELKRQNRANPRLIKRVEKKVLAYHKPI